MNKRSAMLMAAGLVVTMIIAGVAISASLSGLAASAAAPRVTQPRAHKPVVKTIRTTRTVHKKAPQAAVMSRGSGVTSMTTPVTYTSPTSTSSYIDDGGRDDAGHDAGEVGDD